MNTEDIQKFLDSKTSAGNEYVHITFKKRAAIEGLFIRTNRDYTELKTKNFWRIVPKSQFDAYNKTKDLGLAKIFCGAEFSRLRISKEEYA